METSKQNQVFQKVVQKAWGDADFKRNLLENPVQTIENFTGETLNIPEGKNFKVVDQTDASTIYFNLPAEEKVEDVELNEDQLDLVSGGGLIEPIIVGPKTISISNAPHDFLKP